MPRWFQVHLIPRIETILRSQRARLAAALFAFFSLVPVAALAQGSPFDTGFSAIQSLFTGTIAKVASLVAIVIGGYGFAHGEPGAKKALAGVAAGTGIAVMAVNVLSWLVGSGRTGPSTGLNGSDIPDNSHRAVWRPYSCNLFRKRPTSIPRRRREANVSRRGSSWMPSCRAVFCPEANPP